MNIQQPTQHYISCPHEGGTHCIACLEWGAAENPRVLICVHGLTRNSRDFDFLARALSEHYRVICPDVAGRGRSDWLDDPMQYSYPQYVQDMITVLDTLQLSAVDWVGTSMGGLIGMMMAAMPDTPIQRLVLNDIGAFIPQAGLARIYNYLITVPPRHFRTLADAEDYIRFIYRSFGPLTDEQWQHLTRYSLRDDVKGGYTLIYDTRIAEPFKHQPATDIDLWQIFALVKCPILVMRGADSDLLPASVLQKMQAQHADLQAVEFAGVGHAPALLSVEQITVIHDWLLKQGSC